MSKWIIFALLVFVVYLQYTVLEKLKQVPTRKEVFNRIEESSSAAVRRLEGRIADSRANIAGSMSRIENSMLVEQEVNTRLRSKVEKLEQKIAALTPSPTPKPARSR